VTISQAVATYTDGEIIEYTSFHESGYSIGQVIRYAPVSKQTRPCPNCERLVVPGAGPDDGLRPCPYCLASCRFPALDPLVYIRSRSGSKPFQVRESQLRRRASEAVVQEAGQVTMELKRGAIKWVLSAYKPGRPRGTILFRREYQREAPPYRAASQVHSRLPDAQIELQPFTWKGAYWASDSRDLERLYWCPSCDKRLDDWGSGDGMTRCRHCGDEWDLDTLTDAGARPADQDDSGSDEETNDG
jgi:hypothetical protein